MFWSIEAWVLRGEIDNRVRGRVQGRLWLRGRSDPLVLELAGNCLRDTAGSRLTFKRPNEKLAGVRAPGRALLTPWQRGWVGDLTASRKVQLPQLSATEATEPWQAEAPERVRLANGLYLEWFNKAGDRVVVESVEYRCTLDGYAWAMSVEEELVQRHQNARRRAAWQARSATGAGEESSGDAEA